jgi:hypothetical protein
VLVVKGTTPPDPRYRVLSDVLGTIEGARSSIMFRRAPGCCIMNEHHRLALPLTVVTYQLRAIVVVLVILNRGTLCEPRVITNLRWDPTSHACATPFEVALSPTLIVALALLMSYECATRNDGACGLSHSICNGEERPKLSLTHFYRLSARPCDR